MPQVTNNSVAHSAFLNFSSLEEDEAASLVGKLSEITQKSEMDIFRGVVFNIRSVYKRCKHCRKKKHYSEFYRDSAKPDNRKYRCKDCCSLRASNKLEYKKQKNSVELCDRLKDKKWCEGCDEYKSTDDFYKKASGRRGVVKYCISCHSRKVKNKRLSKNLRDLEIDWVDGQLLIQLENARVCTSCKKLKGVDKFGKDERGYLGKRSSCIKCEIDRKNEWKENNREYVKQYRKRYNRENKDRKAKWVREKRENDPQFRLIDNYRTRVYCALKKGYKSDKTKSLLGIDTWENFYDYIEDQFEEGMTWDNYGSGWHLDHIIPLSKFNLDDEKQQVVAFRYTNCQPLWSTDNLEKSNKIPNLFEGIEIDEEFLNTIYASS